VDIIENDKPREKLLAYGVDSLADHELLAIHLRTGYQGKDVFEWARELLRKHGGWAGLAELSADDLIGKSTREPGFGEAKAAELLAVVEIGRRIASSRVARTPIHTPNDAFHVLNPILRGENQERFLVLSLDTRSRMIKLDVVFIGTIDHAVVHPRDVFAMALRRKAARIIIAHNHPSGDPDPSRDDEAITLRLIEGGKVLGIEVVDHLIIGEGQYVSLKERGVFIS